MVGVASVKAKRAASSLSWPISRSRSRAARPADNAHRVAPEEPSNTSAVARYSRQNDDYFLTFLGDYTQRVSPASGVAKRTLYTLLSTLRQIDGLSAAIGTDIRVLFGASSGAIRASAGYP